MKSNVEREEPRLANPNTLIDDPVRKNARNFRELPTSVPSNTLKDEPSHAQPYTLKEEPQRPNDRRLRELPRCR
jgi:hypothetical protein